MNVKNKSILITDGGSLLGKYIAGELAAAGAQVAVNLPSRFYDQCALQPTAGAAGESTGKLADKVTGCNDCGTQAYDPEKQCFLETYSDLLVSQEVEEVFRKVMDRHGKIDALIHNHDFVVRNSIEECDEDTFHKVMEWNAKTAFFCTQAAGRYMEEGGRILYLSSIHDEKPTGCAFTYSLSKGAVKMLCRESAVMLGRKGIRSNLIELGAGPGDDKTFESDLSNLYRHYESKIPIDTFVSCQDVSNLVLFLCSEESSALNGADIRMDGGHILNYFGSNKPINQGEGR